ncbi:universal stress protein [Muricauda sp. SCSIO 64092]|uniref:universal stress protein n=1 Tax=Allomuricauda sp. SCSIO 64092 TaxID=2908842 RepID=UPI001FF6EC14|nr:universal stress protein [Muricauda sp. SCSIO 64092]UOY08985.1 universal stress protein [Muricauda sp. SCSIO 64092]
METVLCAIDYSKNAIPTLKFGYTLGRKLGLKLVVLHVFDMNIGLVTPMSMTFAKLQKKAFEDELQKLSDFCKTHLGVLPKKGQLSVVVRENAILEEELIDAIHSFDARLLIMGMKGKSALKDAIMGSSTKNMITKSTCPLIAIPPVLNHFEINSISYATDFEESDIHALDWVTNTLAKPLKAKINVVHIVTDEGNDARDQMEWFKEMLQQKVDYRKIKYHFIKNDNVFKGLRNYLKKGKNHLLVMLERGHRGFLETFTEIDKVKRMSSKGNIPLLSINKKRI